MFDAIMHWFLAAVVLLLGTTSATFDHSHFHHKRASIVAQNENTTKFAVDGKAIPGQTRFSNEPHIPLTSS